MLKARAAAGTLLSQVDFNAPMTQIPEIPDFHTLLQSQARTQPDAIAVVDGAREISYAQFAADIEKVARRLNTYSMAPGSRAVLFFTSHYLHWLAVLALWRLGVISVSVYSLAQKDLFALLRANVLISEGGNLRAEGGGMIAMSEQWLSASVDALPPLPGHRFDLQQPVRILLSSGTTGTPKKILYSNATVAARIRHSVIDYAFGPQHRFMSVVGIDTAGGFVYSVVTWAAGGSVALYHAQLPFDRQISQTRTNLLFASPVQAGSLVDALPADFPHPGLTLLVAGGRLPQAVAERARQRLASAIWVVYGSTEAGTVTLSLEPEYANPDVVGPLVSTAQVRIVDAAGQAVPRGTVGEVCMRGVCCVESYLDDPEATRGYFRDGWFHPGDLGVLSEANVLSIVGRVGDVMNLGGVKVAPGVIEDVLMACPGVQDVAAFSVPDSQGTEALWVAVVASEGYAEEELKRRYQERFPNRKAPSIALLAEIPRNGMAKVQRNQLRTMVMERLQREAAAPAITFGFRTVSIDAGENANKEMTMATVKINDKEYDFDKLPDEVKSQLAALQFVDAELQRLNMHRAALQTARAAYLKAVGEAMGAA